MTGRGHPIRCTRVTRATAVRVGFAALHLVATAGVASAQWGGAAASPATAAAVNSGASVVVTVRAIPSRTILSAADLSLAPGPHGSGLASVAEVVGLETRTTLYAGRPVRAEDVGPPALIERNDLVRLSYQRGGLSIYAEGRALDRGGPGDRVRAMNLSSRQTVSGLVSAAGLVEVAK